MDVSKIFFSLKFISKETLFAPKFDSRPVNGLLNECIRHYFFSLEPKKLKKNNNAWSQVNTGYRLPYYLESLTFHIGFPVVRTVTWLPKFLGWISS